MSNWAPELEPGRERSGTNLQKKGGPGGAAFTGDLSAVGGVPGQGGGSDGGVNIFSSAKKENILDEERRLIDKVFSIVDKDNSGAIDTNELREMFNLFGVENHFLDAAIERVMTNVDKDRDAQISPEEFYKLLSRKFSKGDSEQAMEEVFDRFGARPPAASKNKEDPQKELGIEELHKVALTLGESSMTKPEIKDMIRCFKRLAQPIINPPVEDGKPSARTKPPKLRPEHEHYQEEEQNDPANIMNLKEFIAIMNMEL